MLKADLPRKKKNALPADLQAVKTAHYGQVYFGLYAA